MIDDFSLGETLVSAVEEAVKNPRAIKQVRPKPCVDIPRLRKSLKMSQTAFANTYGLNIETLRNWEQGNRTPDSATSAYLHCIEKSPQTISELLSE